MATTSGTDGVSTYGPPTPCPVLTSRIGLPGKAMSARVCYTTSTKQVAAHEPRTLCNARYCSSVWCYRCVMAGTGVSNGAIGLRSAIRCPALT
eukprot:850331-Rhodomonas_salina.3